MLKESKKASTTVHRVRRERAARAAKAGRPVQCNVRTVSTNMYSGVRRAACPLTFMIHDSFMTDIEEGII